MYLIVKREDPPSPNHIYPPNICICFFFTKKKDPYPVLLNKGGHFGCIEIKSGDGLWLMIPILDLNSRGRGSNKKFLNDDLPNGEIVDLVYSYWFIPLFTF